MSRPQEPEATWTIPAPPARPAPGNPPPGGRRVALALTAATAVVALAAAGAFGYLWWDTDRELTETRADLTAQVADLSETTDAQADTIEQLERDLQHTRDELALAERDLQGAQNMVELLRDEQSVIRRCVALNNEVLDAIITGDEAAFNAVIDEMEEVCDEADAILSN